MALANPIRGGVDPAATTDTELYPTPGNANATKYASVWVTATNRTSSPINIRIAIDEAGGGVGDTEYDLYDFPLPAFDSVKRGPFSLIATDEIIVRASAVDVTFRYDGWEEA